MALERLQPGFDGVGQEAVVCIVKQNELTRARSPAAIPSLADTTLREGDEPNTGNGLDDLGRGIGRPVVHHHDLECWDALTEGALDRFADVRCFVMARDNH